MKAKRGTAQGRKGLGQRGGGQNIMTHMYENAILKAICQLTSKCKAKMYVSNVK